ncbi:MAG: metallopeptidase family protein, partial [Pseudomonadota bacterium]|nr:metallopeptidase family protein [Pseudomonadota bacterium]
MNTVAPTAADIENLALQAFDTLPDMLRAEVGEIVFRVEEFPDEAIIRSMELESGFELLGLYQGIDILNRSVSDPSPDVDIIFFYRRPLLDYWLETGETMERLVRHVL